MDTGFFHILAILNNMAMNRKMQISFQDNDYFFKHTHILDFPGGSDNKESACNAGDAGSVPG